MENSYKYFGRKRNYCIECGERIWNKRSNAKLCSDCFKKKYKRRILRYKSDGVEIQCKMCGDMFISKSRLRKFCDICRVYRKQISSKKINEKNKRKCIVCGEKCFGRVCRHCFKKGIHSTVSLMRRRKRKKENG